MKIKVNSFLLIASSILLLFFIVLLLYWQPLFSNKPLGLDTIGHLSRVSYIQEFGMVNWDMNWYNGGPFLAFYSPLFYYITAFFPNIFFGANLIAVLSIFLTAVGIFLIVNFHTKSIMHSLLASFLFLSVLCTSYYYLSVGNLPFFSAIFTIPFTLYFLDKSLVNKKYFFLYAFFFLLAFLLHIFMALCLFVLVGFKLLLFNLKDVKIKSRLGRIIIYLGIPLLISSFWFLPFLSKTGNFVGTTPSGDYIPSFYNLLGIKDHIIWGLGPGQIGFVFLLFLFSLFFMSPWKIKEKHSYFFYSSLCFLLLLFGILGKYYPTGFGPTRFIIPLTILLCIFLGIFLAKINLGKKFLVIIFLLCFMALFFNYELIDNNYENYSYGSVDSRYGFLEFIENNSLPFNNSFLNYRFGTNHYIFSEPVNFNYPWLSQTRGYYDQSIYYPEEYWKMTDKIWNSNNLSLMMEYLDWYGIKYLEVSNGEIKDELFYSNNNFKLIFKDRFYDYSFSLYEYLGAKPIISVISNLSDIHDLGSYVERLNPDNIKVYYNFTGNETILFKESYHESWKAKELPSNKFLEINPSAHNFMYLTPSNRTTEVVFFQVNTKYEVFGIVLSITGVIFLILYLVIGKLENTNILKEI